jgi:autotransporter-associated beta strand protein
MDWRGGVANPYWTTAANWGGTAPVAGDSLVFQGSQTTSEDNFAAGTPFDGVTFASGASSFTLTGLGAENVLISGAAAGNNTGVINNSAAAQTFTTLNLHLDWGYYTFGSSGGGTLHLNDTLSPAVNFGTSALGFYPYFGGVAYFITPTSSSTFTLDPNGLITGLDGMGLMATSVGGTYYLGSPPGNLRPLATIGGGQVKAYTAYTTKTGGGTILNSASANVELADTTTANYTADNITVNSITVDNNPGNGAGTTTITVGTPPAHTLTLGGQGGIYVTDSVQGQPGAGSRQLLKFVGPGNLTAQTGGPLAGMLVLGVNGTTSGNQLQVDDIIINNNNAPLSPVTLVKTGPGSALLSRANTYTGGTYVDQGFLEVSTGSGFGPGPVFVASGAEVYLEQSGATWANSFSISPGSGPFYSNPDGAINIANGTLAGPLKLLGSPSTSGPGNRIGVSAPGGAAALTGQVSGTGTLELMAEADYAIFFFDNSSGLANNWTGGLLIDEAPNENGTVYLSANNQLASNNVTLIQSGTGSAILNLAGFSDTIGGLYAGPNPNNQVINDPFLAGGSTLTLGAGDATAFFGGVISDNGFNSLSIIKIGAGTQILSGANDYSGTTTVNAGTLVTTTASTGGGDYIVNNGASLEVQVANLGKALQMYNLTLNSGCSLEVESYIYGLSPSSAPITVNGSISGSGSVNIQLSGSLAPGTYHLVKYSSGSFSGSLNPIFPIGYNGLVSDDGRGLISVTISGPGPDISLQPTSQTVCADPSVFTTFVVGEVSTPFFTFQWYVSTDNGNTWEPDTADYNVNGGDLQVADIPFNNHNKYEVVVQDIFNNYATSSSASLTVNPSPTIYTVTGGGSYCPGGTGVSVGLSGSDSGVSYQLVQLVPALGGGNLELPVGTPMPGTGSQFIFPTQVTAGTYTVTAEPVAGGCLITMNGPVTVTANQSPVAGNNLWETTQNYPVSVPEVNLLLNASSQNPNPVYTFTGLGPTPGTSSIILPSGAGVTTANGVITYRPSSTLGVTSDSFTYNFYDGTCSAVGTVNVTIVPPMSPVTPQLNNVAIQGVTTCVDLAYSGQPSTTYTLQFTTDLVNWTCVQSVGPPNQSGPVYYFSGCPTGPATPPAGFYRIVTGGCPP